MLDIIVHDYGVCEKILIGVAVYSINLYISALKFL